MSTTPPDSSSNISNVNGDGRLKEALTLIHLNLHQRTPLPATLPGNQEEQALLLEILDTIKLAEDHIIDISEGRLHNPIQLTGFFGGALKSLQSKLRHLTWKTQMIAKGDFSQRVDYLGDFSEAFNSMVRDLDDSKQACLRQGEELKEINEYLIISNEQYKSFILKAPISICIITEGKISLTNPAFGELLDIKTIDAVIGESLLNLIQNDNKSYFQRNLDNYLISDVNWSRFEAKLVKHDGSVIIAEMIGTGIVFDNNPATLLFINDITDKKIQEEKILDSLEKKEILLKEVYHRVKNNMQIIGSLLSIQARMVEDEDIRAMFIESQNRIKSLALVHELLYKTDNLQNIPYEIYLQKISSILLNSVNIRFKVNIEANEIFLSLDKAVPCSLIINELITNSLKYANNPDSENRISITFQYCESGEEYILDYRDNGPGISDDIHPETGKTLGMQLIFGLTRQLKGELIYENDNGLHVRIQFPSGKIGDSG